MTAPHTPESGQFNRPQYPPPPSGPPTGTGPSYGTPASGPSFGPPTGRQPAADPPPPQPQTPPPYGEAPRHTAAPVAQPDQPHLRTTGGAQAHQRPEEDLGQPLSNIGQIVSNITEDLSTLVRQETELAKAEIRQSATRAGKGAGLFGGAGVAGHMALLFLSIAAWWGIAHLIESFGWAAVIVGVLWAIAAAVMAAMGRKEINGIKGLERTAETASKIPDALKGNETTNG